MATFVWAGSTGNNPLTGSNWRVGGVSQASPPTAADDVLFGSGSGATNNPCTIPTASTMVCRSVDFTGYTGTFSFATSTAVLSIGDATAGTGNVALKLVSGMTLTLTGVGTINFLSTSATQQTVTTAGKTMPNMTFNGAGSSYLLSDNLTSSATITHSAGTLNTGSKTISCSSFNYGNATTRTLTLGSSSITCTNVSSMFTGSAATGLTVTANTATVTCSGAVTSSNNIIVLNNKDWNGLSINITGGGQGNINTGGVSAKLANLTITGTALKTNLYQFTGDLTVTGTLTLNSNSDANCIQVASSGRGTARTITAASLVCSNRIDFMDITGAGAATWTTGASGASYFGDMNGNSGITMTTPMSQTMSGGGSWSDPTKFSGGRSPLPQDDVTVSGSTAITFDMQRPGKSIDFSSYTGTVTSISSSLEYNIMGSLTLGSGMSWGSNPNTFNVTFSGRGSYTITTNGKALFPAGSNATMKVDCVSGSYTLQDALDYKTPLGSSMNFTSGTFNANGYAISTGRIVSSSGFTRAVTFGSIVDLYSTTATDILTLTTAGITLSASSTTFTVKSATANARILNIGGCAIGTFDYTVAGSTGQLTVSTAAIIGTLNFSDASNARSLIITANATLAVLSSFNVYGTSGKLMTVASGTSGTKAYISKPIGGAIIGNEYLSIQDIHVVQPLNFFTGANCTNVSGNSGIRFGSTGTYKHVQSTATTISATSVTATYVIATTPGNLLVAYVEGSGTTGATVTAPSGWTQAVSSSQSSIGYIYYKVADGTETSVTYSQTTSRTLTMEIVEYTGFSGRPTLDVTDSNGSGIAATSLSTTATTGPTNTAQPALALAWVGGASTLASLVSLTNSFVQDYTSTNVTTIMHTAVKELTTTAAVDTTFTWTTSRASLQTGLAVFKDVSSNMGNFFEVF